MKKCLMCVVYQYQAVAQKIALYAPMSLPLIARVLFAAILAPMFWRSAFTKFADGFPLPSDSAYIQMFPLAFEAAEYDSANMGFIYHVIALFGSYAEFILPFLLIIGLFSRLSAVAMLGFLVVMTFVDVVGHGVSIGGWFHGAADEVIADQRSLWAFLLFCILGFGGGWLSVDSILQRCRRKSS